MNVKRIVVSELPKACNDNCKFNNHEWTPFCILAGKIIHAEHIFPDWCPLEVEEVCEWAHKKFDNHWDEYTPITCCKTAEEKNKFETLRLVGMGVEYKFCPSCGKPIKYVEVE